MPILLRNGENKLPLFHTNRGNEFKNKLSLNTKGCPYDNTVAEATYKIFKTEFVHYRHFASLKELTLELNDYVNWFNKIKIHDTLGNLSSVQYRQEHRKKLSSFVLIYQLLVFIDRETI